MEEPTTATLSIGDVGEAIYESQAQEWRSLRSYKSADVFNPVSGASVVQRDDAESDDAQAERRGLAFGMLASLISNALTLVKVTLLFPRTSRYLYSKSALHKASTRPTLSLRSDTNDQSRSCALPFWRILRPRRAIASGVSQTSAGIGVTFIVRLSLAPDVPSEYADVAFNPQEQYEIATIDSHGHWCVWRISSLGHLKLAHGLSKQASGRFSDGPLDEKDDGWHKIFWGPSRSLILCNRNEIRYVDIAQPCEPDAKPLSPKLKEEDSFHLDIRQHPGLDDQFIVLTERYITLIPHDLRAR
ncbi:hypothetical protein MRB53_037351 [Persea americana]|nr:hypothetical protein MRB53_037351 [Persea americana]